MRTSYVLLASYYLARLRRQQLLPPALLSARHAATPPLLPYSTLEVDAMDIE